MMNVSERNGSILSERLDGAPPQRIVILRALMLGDLLCSVPALRTLRVGLPNAEITLVGLPWARSFVQRFSHYLNDFIEFPGYPGLPEREPQLDRIPHFFADVQRRRFDLAIQMHGSGSFVNSITVLFGARINAGFYLPGEYCPDEEWFMPFPEDETEVGLMSRLMEFLGAPSQGDELEFPLTANDWSELDQLKDIRELSNDPYVCLHPGARFPSRRWPAERFSAVGDALSRLGLRVIITGSKDESELAEAVCTSMREPHWNVAGRTTIGALGALLSGARLLISNDTGVSHLAAALRVPSVIVVSGSDYKRWAPHNGRLHRIVQHPVECRPCMHLVCPIGHPCAQSVTVEEVFSQAKALLP